MEKSVLEDDKALIKIINVMSQVISSMILLTQYIENEYNITLNDKVNNIDKNQRLKKIKSKYKLLYNKLNDKLSSSDASKATKAKFNKGVQSIPEDDFIQRMKNHNLKMSKVLLLV